MIVYNENPPKNPFKKLFEKNLKNFKKSIDKGKQRCYNVQARVKNDVQKQKDP